MKKQPPDVQAQRIDARRGQILDAATHVFADKGFHAATVRDIARAAGLADGTLYLYFQSKADLLLGILARLNESERRALDLAALAGLAPPGPGSEGGERGEGGGGFRSFLTGYIRHRLTVLDENLRAFQAVLPDILRSPELRERYLREVIEPTFRLGEPVLEELIARGALQPVDVQLALRAIPGLILGLLILRMLGDPALTEKWAALPELVTGMIFDGLLKESPR
ncbi:MAG: helix-turn-helix domain-containing protein [Polyangia bacterium]